MGNTSPWAATNRRASLLSLDKLQATSFKQQAASDKLRQHVNYAPDTGMILWSRAARELVSMIQYKPCEACIREEAGSSSQQKGKICQELHLSLMIKNLKWRILLTNMVSRTTRWEQPTIISTFLRELGSNETKSLPGSGTEETSSINQHGPGNPGAIIMHPIPKPQAASRKLQAPSSEGSSEKLRSCSRCKRQASSPKRQASSFKPQAASSCTW